MMRFVRIAIAILLVTAVGRQVFAEQIFLDFQGNGGFGLLPENEVPPITTSGASGGEIGMGLVYDDVTNMLFMLFDFDGLTGGINTGVASGMHLHLASDINDPFGSTGGIVFNLNSGTDANVTYNSPLIINGAVSGSVDVGVSLSEAQEADLLAGRYYLNIHSAEFGGGELRGNLVRAIPEPATSAIMGLGLLALVCRRRK
jgi:hypothetical protein